MSGAWALVLPLLAGLLSTALTVTAAVLVARYGKAEKRLEVAAQAEESAAAHDVSLQHLVDERIKALITQLGTRVDELEEENKALRLELREERTARQRLEVQVSTLRAQLARLSGLAAGAEADTAGGDD